MGLTKSYLHNENTNLLATVLKTLGNPARLRIVKYLLVHQNCNNKELVEELQLGQATVSQHVKEMKAMNLVLATQVENTVRYRLNKDLLNHLMSVLHMFFEIQVEVG